MLEVYSGHYKEMRIFKTQELLLEIKLGQTFSKKLVHFRVRKLNVWGKNGN